LIVCSANDVGAQVLADLVHKTGALIQIYLTLMIVANALTLSLLELTTNRFRMLYDAQEGALLEKCLLQKMLAMLCDGTFTVGEDADTILSCDDRFDHLMGTSMTAESLMMHVGESEHEQEHERLKQAFKRARKEPVLIQTTLVCRNRSTHATELLIVYRGSKVQYERQTVLTGYTVGVRIVSEKATHNNADFDLERPEERHVVCADTEDRGPKSSWGSQSNVSEPESLPTTTYTGDLFASVKQGIEGEYADRTSESQIEPALEEIRLLGKQEHWLIDPSDVKRNDGVVLGRGGFGTVFSANMYGVEVAVKVATQIEGKSQVKNFVALSNELRVLRHIRHPSIVLFHGAIIHPRAKEISLVLERVYGQELSTFLSVSNGPKTMHVRLHIIIDVCCALWYLHAQRPQIVYGDLKGSNLLVEHHWSSDPHVKLLDFGLARLIMRDAQPLGGTLRWMAPEVMRNLGEKPKTSADIFSFGRLIHYVITGLLPLDGFTRQHMKKLALRGQIPSLRWPHTVPAYEKGKAICDSCLVLTPSLRSEIANIHEQLVDWRAALNNESRSASLDHAAAASSSSMQQQAGIRSFHTAPTVQEAVDTEPEEPKVEEDKIARCVIGSKILSL